MMLPGMQADQPDHLLVSRDGPVPPRVCGRLRTQELDECLGRCHIAQWFVGEPLDAWIASEDQYGRRVRRGWLPQDEPLGMQIETLVTGGALSTTDDRGRF
jgi:hypothetical protein